jgi:hypothetical protein
MFHRHKHDWMLITADHMEYVHFGGGAVTLMLYRCSLCKRVETRRMEGWWTQDQIEGKQ